MAKAIKADYIATIIQAYYPEDHNFETKEVSSRIYRLNRLNKADLADLAVTAQRVLDDRLKESVRTMLF